MLQNVEYVEELYIKRDDNCLHYIYTRRLDDGSIIGFYFDSEYLCDNLEELINSFRNIYNRQNAESLVSQTLNGVTVAQIESFDNDRRVNINIFLEEFRFRFRGSLLPAANLGISKSDVVRCSFQIKGSKWILSKIKDGYHQIKVICNESPIKNEIIKDISKKSWGWKTWTLFLILILILTTVLYIICNDPVLRTNVKFKIENII
ncbi:MAG: hypothetical protein J1E63_02875 [Muribaculaceae bacterium]|nr:hypothetical protein [Muribaculaceae bacterium]